MKSKRLFLLFVAVLLVFSALRTFAVSPVTFKVLDTFDYPGGAGINTYAMDINEQNLLAGYFITEHTGTFGFVRFGNRFSEAISHPMEPYNFTEVTGLNSSRILCGYYVGSDYYVHGFLLSGSTYTTVDVGQNTRVNRINDAGNICGSIGEGAAFVIIDGTTTTFTIPGADYTEALGINNANQSVGYYIVGERYYGFFRDSDGTLTYPFTTRDAFRTLLYDINDKGQMVGSVTAGTDQGGVLFLSPNKYVIYDYPGANDTYFYGINNHGLICGSYIESSAFHGLIVKVTPAAGE